MSNIFNISLERLQLIEQLEDAMNAVEADENEINEGELIKALEINEAELHDKIKSYYYVIKMKEGEIKLAEDEIKRLQQAKQTKENLIDRLKDSVNEALKMWGTKTDAGGYKMKVGDLSVWNVFHKPVRLSDDFSDTKYAKYTIKDRLTKEEIEAIKKAVVKPIETDISFDKTKIKYDLQSGIEIKGATIDNDASYVRFK
ncbi:Siphovirus Gp157 [anaerobic digester metagenome]